MSARSAEPGGALLGCASLARAVPALILCLGMGTPARTGAAGILRAAHAQAEWSSSPLILPCRSWQSSMALEHETSLVALSGASLDDLWAVGSTRAAGATTPRPRVTHW